MKDAYTYVPATDTFIIPGPVMARLCRRMTSDKEKVQAEDDAENERRRKAAAR